MSRKKTYSLMEEKNKSLINVYIGIGIIVVVLLPIVIMPLRYQIGEALSTIINGIGKFSLVIGSICIAFGVVGIFTRSRYWVSSVIVGAILLWIGAWCTGTIIELFGFSISGPDNTGGGSGYY